MIGEAAGRFARREFVAGVRATWFVVYASAFLVGGTLLATLGLNDSVIHGYRGYAQSFAGLAHLALLFVPLMALFPATASVADERDRGTLEYWLAQPVRFADVYIGKWIGVACAMILTVSGGFGIGGAVALARGVPPRLLIGLYGFVVFLALAFVALGLWFSVAARSRAQAATLGVATWLILVSLGSLGVIVAFVRWGVPEWVLVGWTFVNPVEAFRIGMLSLLDPDLSLLGPVGAGLVARFGEVGVGVGAALSLGVWSVLPGVIGLRRFIAGDAIAPS